MDKDKDEIKDQPTSKKGEEATYSKDKIDKALENFLKEQEEAVLKEQKRKVDEIKAKRRHKQLLMISAGIVGALVLATLIFNPYSQKLWKEFLEARQPKEEYTLSYNYSPGMEILPFQEGLLMYDSQVLKNVSYDGNEKFSVNLTLDKWDLEASGKNIYLLDKINKELYFINNKGEFKSKATLNNLPDRLISGKEGNVAVYYKTEVGVEGITLFDKSGKQLTDLTYPKVTITNIEINDLNQMSVQGIYRMSTKLTNNIYKYSSGGNLIYSNSVDGMIVVDEIPFDSNYALVDVNNIVFYNSNHEEIQRFSSVIPYKSVQKFGEDIYILDKRNKLLKINKELVVAEEKYYQTQFDDMIKFNEQLIFYSGEGIKAESGIEMKFEKPIDQVFITGDYLVIVTRGEIRLMNKLPKA